LTFGSFTSDPEDGSDGRSEATFLFLPLAFTTGPSTLLKSTTKFSPFLSSEVFLSFCFCCCCCSDPRADRQNESPSDPDPDPAEPFLPLRTLFLEGGIRCPGSSSGRSNPSSLMLIRCIARANSSESSIPS